MFSPLFQLAPGSKQQYRIEIALHRMIVSDRSPSFIQRNAPVEPNDLGSGLRHGRQKRRAVGTEIDDGNFGFLLQALNELGGGHQYVAAIILDTQTAYPAVEDLQGVSP